MNDQSTTLELVMRAKDEASTSIKNIGTNLKGVAKDIGSDIGDMASAVVGGLKTASVALGGLGVGLTAYAKDAASFTQQYVGNVKTLGRQIGAATDETSRLLFATQRLGISADQASTLFGAFSRNIQQAAEGSKQAESKFSDLGVKIKDNQGNTRAFSDVLLDVADKFKSMPDGVQKTATSMDLFGRSGKDLIPLLNQGSQGIKDLEAQADKLGLTLTSETVGAVTKLVESQKELTATSDALKLKVGTLTIPVLTSFNKVLNDMLGTMMGVGGPFSNVLAQVLAFGGPIATAAAGAFGFAASLATINKGLGTVATAILGVVAAFIGTGGLVFAAQQFLGLNFGPIGEALGRMFQAFVVASNEALKHLKELSNSPEWGNLRTRGNDAIVSVAQALDRITDKLKSGGFGAAFKQIQAEIDKLDLGGALNRAIAKIDFGAMLTKVLNGISAFPWENYTSLFIDGFLRMLTSFATRAQEVTAKVVPIILGIIPPIIDGLIEGIFTFVTQHPLDAVNLLLTLGFAPTKLISAIGKVLGNIPIAGPILEWMLNAMKSLVDGMLKPITDWFGGIGKGIVKNLREGVETTVGGFFDVLRSIGGKIAEPFQSIGSKIGGFFNGAGAWLVKAGQDIINGLLNGIGNVGGTVANWFLDKIPGWIKEPFKKALGIKSPSKVFAEYGKFTMQGLQQGLLNNRGSIQDAMQQVSGDVAGNFTPNAIASPLNAPTASVLTNAFGSSGYIPNQGAQTNNTQSSLDKSTTNYITVQANVNDKTDMNVWARQIAWELGVRG